MFTLQIVIYSLLPVALAQYTPSPRWGQAVSLQENTLYVHGGLSDSFNSYSYSSAPRISDLLVLDLSMSFNSSSPPWQLFSANSSPALAWHTLSAFNTSDLLLFGGHPGPNSLTVLSGLNDSSYLLSTSGSFGPSFLIHSQNWANEPMRRIRHSSSYANGKVWLIGGEKADGSGNAFSDHYFFNPSGPDFVQLAPSSTAPPDIYGHTSLVLQDGRLLVFGGYCVSCSCLVPMNTVWSLNTTQSPPLWEKLSVLNGSLPNPRRDFAAVVLLDGQVLIHGGGDAQLQTTYSDGWLLDTRQNPMVWKSVETLAELGHRKDHFAVQAGGFVLFCFGYGSFSPASSSLFIYDPTSSSMVTSYTAPIPGSQSVVTSLAGPIPTESIPNSNGGSGTASGSSTGTPSHISGSHSDSSRDTVGIVLGTTFGVLGLVIGALATTYYMQRVRNRSQTSTEKFVPLADDLEFSLSDGSLTAPEVAHVEGEVNKRARGVVVTDILAYLGISKFRSETLYPRKDMFADEDSRSFGWVGRSSTVQRQGSEGTSVWSFRSVGALVRGVIGSEPGGSGANQGDREWEKNDHHSEEGQEGLIRQGSLRSQYSSHPTHRNDGSFWSYTDPFEDPIPDDYDDLNLRPGTPEKDAGYDHSVRRSHETDNFERHPDPVWPFAVASHMPSPLREVSRVSLSDPSSSLPSLQEPSLGQTSHSHADNPVLTPPSPTLHSPTTSRSSDTHAISPFPHYSSISNSTLSHSQSLSRPDSWWYRLTKPPLLDRRASNTTPKPLSFRDPTPAPPFVMPEETKKPTSTSAHSNDTLADVPARHDRSLGSAHSGRTANTDSAEHLGGTYDVVQRLASDGSSSRRAPSLGSAEITEQGMFAIDNAPPSAISMSGALPHVDPPRSALVPADPAMCLDMEAPSRLLVSPRSTPSPQKNGAIVAGRIRAYEHRLSREMESQQTPPPRNTRHREEIPSQSRPTIQYGVAPRASLFIANPDLGHIS